MNELNDKPVPEGELKVSLTCHQRPDIKIHLMLPVKDRKLDIDMLASGWPRAYGYWEGSVWGRVEWDEENQLLLVYWSDDDLSLVDLIRRSSCTRDDCSTSTRTSTRPTTSWSSRRRHRCEQARLDWGGPRRHARALRGLEGRSDRGACSADASEGEEDARAGVGGASFHCSGVRPRSARAGEGRGCHRRLVFGTHRPDPQGYEREGLLDGSALRRSLRAGRAKHRALCRRRRVRRRTGSGLQLRGCSPRFAEHW